jgi:adenosylmethionine-8-amino-7-oxononanoate aminotransferase
MHGPTFMGNALACACAQASIDLLLEGDWRGSIARIGRGLEAGLAPCRTLPGVVDVRTLGAIGVVELETPIDMRMAAPAFVERGVWVRPFGRLVYVMPPYVISNAETAQLAAAIGEVVALHAENTA